MKSTHQPNKRSILYSLLTVVMAVGLSACATTQQTRSAKASGFLKDYSQLKKGTGKEAQFVYVNPDTKFAAYDKVLIEPVTIWAEANSSLAKVPKEELQSLANYLHMALTTHLEQNYEIVDRAGPGVMRVRAAITEARGSNVTVDVISTAIPQLRLLSSGIKLGADTHVFVGKASIEGEILDSLTNERLFAAVDQRAGAKALRGSLGTWNDVKDAYDYWANRLKVRLGELRAQ